ncbi:MAG TPA: hypothetical protein VFW84_15290 [Aquabacterium sp.]|uniref:hypothetical protein n=1 Tax=Aquabacterium sp. TaxID=1872578 RepID=UPI002E2FF9C6|nr:hypothetical protein [Aquabacterium sp.]HEX5374088.1 hypothetical protein [Aquabacterium sp.]
MWKLLVAFIAFAAIAIFVLMKSGGDIDMGGEKHGAEATHTEEAAASHDAASDAASAAYSAAASAASAASVADAAASVAASAASN